MKSAVLTVLLAVGAAVVSARAPVPYYTPYKGPDGTGFQIRDKNDRTVFKIDEDGSMSAWDGEELMDIIEAFIEQQRQIDLLTLNVNDLRAMMEYFLGTMKPTPEPKPTPSPPTPKPTMTPKPTTGFVPPTPKSTPESVFIGGRTSGLSSNNFSPGTQFCQPAFSGGSYTVTKFGIQIAAQPPNGSSWKLALYEDSSNSPGNLMTETDWQVATMGYLEAPVTHFAQVDAGQYWICSLVGGANTVEFGVSESSSLITKQGGEFATNADFAEPFIASQTFNFYSVAYWFGGYLN